MRSSLKKIINIASYLFLLIVVVIQAACLIEKKYENRGFLINISNCSKYRYSDTGRLIYVVVGEVCVTEAPLGVKISLEGEEYKYNLSVGEELILPSLSGLTGRRIEFIKENSWREISNMNAWSPRDGAGLLYLNGYLYLIGGWNYETVVSEVWRTDNLIDWERLPDGPWEARHGAGWVVHDKKLWVVGGDLIPDVWSSSDGIVWDNNTFSAPFGKRYTPSVVSDGTYIYLYGGQYWEPIEWCNSRPDCTPVGLNDIWRTKDGVDFELMLSAAPWEGRALVHGGLFFKGRIYIVGGGLKNATERHSETFAEFSDIWSSADGVFWTKEKDVLGFSPRTHFSVTSTSYGCFVSDGSLGIQSNVTNDLYFAADCVNYVPQVVPASMKKRHASSLAEFNGSILITGGPPTDAPGTSIWQYFPKL